MTEKLGESDLQVLLQQLREVEFPTLGHFLENGFCNSEIRSMVTGVRMVGIASTVLIPDADAVSVNQALLRLLPGEVLVLAMGGDLAHAPVGAVTVAAAKAQGAAGILVDGPITDVIELNTRGSDGKVVPVFARGSTCLTTKRLGSGLAQFGVPVTVGGTVVNPGDVVLGDDNGVLVITAEAVARVVDLARDSDAAEPDILRRIASGEPLNQILFLG